MEPFNAQDRLRVETALVVLYGGMDRHTSALLASLGKACCCSRRQVERAFERLGTSPGQELTTIRANTAAAHLVHPNAHLHKLQGIAIRVGYRDDRALRREVTAAWTLSPRELRKAARLHRTLTGWDEVRAERLARAADSRRGAVYHRAWRQHRMMLKKLNILQAAAPPETRHLITGRTKKRTAPECTEQAVQAAREHVEALLASRRRQLRAVAA